MPFCKPAPLAAPLWLVSLPLWPYDFDACKSYFAFPACRFVRVRVVDKSEKFVDGTIAVPRFDDDQDDQTARRRRSNRQTVDGDDRRFLSVFRAVAKINGKMFFSAPTAATSIPCRPCCP